MLTLLLTAKLLLVLMLMSNLFQNYLKSLMEAYLLTIQIGLSMLVDLLFHVNLLSHLRLMEKYILKGLLVLILQ
ncbi:MAG: hypothetical protein EBY32_15460 [Proteobacteria bacterium]|nr:hypothetical protein [Pseudomonadota bacterium]